MSLPASSPVPKDILLSLIHLHALVLGVPLPALFNICLGSMLITSWMHTFPFSGFLKRKCFNVSVC